MKDDGTYRMNDNETTPAIEAAPAPQPSDVQPPKKNNMNKVMLGATAFIILLLGVSLLIRVLQQPAADTAANPINAAQENFKYKVGVSITDEGFVPSSVTVDKSTQLTFQNNGSVKHSIVADSETLKIEPTLGYKNGETTSVTLPSGNYSTYYSYTFQNPGTYHVHDGFNPTSNLTVTVK